jgi:superfamily II RNA helicase
VQCPILCLSATIGNPKAFHSWLSTIQKSHGIDVEFIICGHRHSHLKKFVYSKGKEVGKFVTLHPWGSLNSNSTSKIGILKDGTLSSTECLKCYDAIVKVCGESKVLDPEMYFESKFLDRKNVLEYEVELRAFMEGLADKDASKFQGIVETLGKDVKEELEEVVVDPDYLDDKIFDVVMDLKAQRMLPAIMVLVLSLTV